MKTWKPEILFADGNVKVLRLSELHWPEVCKEIVFSLGAFPRNKLLAIETVKSDTACHSYDGISHFFGNLKKKEAMWLRQKAGDCRFGDRRVSYVGENSILISVSS